MQIAYSARDAPVRVGGIEARSAVDRTHDGDAPGARPLGAAADRRGRPRARGRRASRFVSVVSSRSTTPRLRVGDDEIVGLIGTNGAGKSTLMNAIGGFVPCAGTVRIHGDDVSSTGAARRARDGSRPHVPGRAAVPRAHRARDGRGRAGGAWADRPPLHRVVPAPFVHPRAAAARRGRRPHRLPRSRSLRQQPHRRPLHRDPPHRRAGRAPRPRRARAVPRRADRRRRAARDRGVRSADQGDPARAGRGDAGDRARHAAHHEHQRPRLLPRDRTRHRRRRSGDRAQRPEGDRELPRRRRTCHRRAAALPHARRLRPCPREDDDDDDDRPEDPVRGSGRWCMDAEQLFAELDRTTARHRHARGARRRAARPAAADLRDRRHRRAPRGRRRRSLTLREGRADDGPVIGLDASACSELFQDVVSTFGLVMPGRVEVLRPRR